MDTQKLEAFKLAAKQSGYSDEDINAFVSSINIAETPSPEKNYDPSGKTFAQQMAETGQQSTLDQMGKSGFDVSKEPIQQITPEPIKTTVSLTPQNQQTEQTIANLPSTQNTMLPSPAPVTQAFGNRSSIEKYSGGVNLGTDFGVKAGTPLASPSQGKWIVDKAASGFNQGSGNIVRIKNLDTGETIAYEHLSQINVQPGQELEPGSVVGAVGSTGNSTGPHASIPYRNSKGEYQDILNSPYASDIFQQPKPQEKAPVELPTINENQMQSVPPTPAPADQQLSLAADSQLSTIQPVPQPTPAPDVIAPTNIPEKQRVFIEKFSPLAQQVEKDTGIPASVTLAQAGLESGWNPDAKTLFGIKGSGDAGSANLATKEDYGNGMVNENANFAQYSSPEQAFQAYGKLVGSSPIYKQVQDVIKQGGSKEDVVKAIKASGYATDPDYVNKVMSIINQYGL